MFWIPLTIALASRGKDKQPTRRRSATEQIEEARTATLDEETERKRRRKRKRRRRLAASEVPVLEEPRFYQDPRFVGGGLLLVAVVGGVAYSRRKRSR